MKDEYAALLRVAVAEFWATRKAQSVKQGLRSGQKDTGSRGAVTGGKQLDAFIKLVRSLLIKAGLPEAVIHERLVTLPGYFRPTKEWDLLVVANEQLIATLEFKSQVGPSFGNNFNNRTEEAIGSATDLWTAHREGAFAESVRPWLGYFVLLEETSKSTGPVGVREPHFPVFAEFRDASYAKRYELLCLRLVRERLYDAACFITSPQISGESGVYHEPCAETSFARFASSLTGHIATYLNLRHEE